jgi:ABC-type branched-subunit amino acid transport system substrate-binding protein
MVSRGILKASLLSVMLVTVGLAGCLDPAVEDNDDPDVEALRMGTILPLTGDLSPFGPSAQNAVELAVKHVNEAGGVNGQDVELETADSETSEEAATGAASHLIDVVGVHAIVGAMGSGISLAFIDQAVGAQIPMISPSNTAPTFTQMAQDSDTDGWYFRTVPSDALQGAVMADLLHEQGMTRIAILAINNDYGVGFGEVLQDRFMAQAGVVQAFVRYDPMGTDFSSDVEEAAALSPDAIVLIGYPDTGEIIVRQAFERGHIGPDTDIDWYFSEGLKDPEFVREQRTPEGEFILEGYFGTTPEELTEAQFLQDFEAEYGDAPALFSDRTYDAAMIVMLAAEYCSCVSGEEFKQAFHEVQNSPGEEVVYDAARALELLQDGQDIQWTGAAGPMEFDENGDVVAPYSVWQVVDGEIQTVQEDVVPE